MMFAFYFEVICLLPKESISKCIWHFKTNGADPGAVPVAATRVSLPII
jgi:hypothetical protein